MTVHVICPLCGADNAQPRYRLTRGSIVTCTVCDFHYVSPRLPSAEIHAKLQAWAEQDVVDAPRLRVAFEPGTLATYRSHLDRLVPHLSGPRRRLLDLGCSTGALLTVARDLGWDVEGAELGRDSARYARNQLGLTVHEQSLFDFAPQHRYEVVSLLEVIEHLEAPVQALKHIHELLEPSGLLLLSTPNFDSLFRRLYGTDWWVINCEDEHIMFFTRKTLTRALEESGFEVLDLRTRSIDIAGLVRTLVARLRRSRTRRMSAASGIVQRDHDHGYYDARDAKAATKLWLARLGVLVLARFCMQLLDRVLAWRHSPCRDLGEQIVLIARRR